MKQESLKTCSMGLMQVASDFFFFKSDALTTGVWSVRYDL